MTPARAETDLLRLVLLSMYLATAASIVLTRQTGTDYLYYYLPIADYFTWQGFPKEVSPSIIDAPFAYPRAEYILLALTSIFGEYRIYAIKLLLCFKVGVLFWLALRVVSITGSCVFLPAAFIAPSILVFLSIYNTDVNAAIGAMALLLIYLGEKRTLVPWLLVAYAAATKYTFWVLLLPFYAVLWKHGRLGLNGAIPALAIIVHLITNFHHYGNPVYPIGEHVSRTLSPEMQSFIGGWAKSDSAGNWIQSACAGFIAAGGFVLFAAGMPIALLAALSVYVAAWLVGMQVSSGGDTGRFLLPATLIAACFMSGERFRRRGPGFYAASIVVVASCLVFVITHSWLYLLALCMCVAAYVLTCQGGALRNAGYAIAVLTCFAYAGAKIYGKPDIGRDLGYAAYAAQLGEIEEKSGSAIVFTDYKLLPHALRAKNNVVLWYSEVYSPIPRQVAQSGTFDCGNVGVHVIGSDELLRLARRIRFSNCAFVAYENMEPHGQ